MTQVEFRQYAKDGNIEMIKKGLEQKTIDVNKKSRSGDTTISEVIRVPSFTSKMSNNHLKIMEMLLKKGATVSYYDYGSLAMYGHLEPLKLVYKYHTKRIGIDMGSGGFSSSVFNGHTSTVEFILKNANNESGYNPVVLLHVILSAASQIKLDMFKLLYSYIDRPNIHNNDHILAIFKKTKNEEIKKIILSTQSVVDTAVENAQEELYPASVKDIFLF